MDIAAAASSLSSASVGQDLNLVLLKAQNQLDSTVAAQLAASIGLGLGVDAYA